MRCRLRFGVRRTGGLTAPPSLCRPAVSPRQGAGRWFDSTSPTSIGSPQGPWNQVREILLRPDVLLAGEQALVSREPAPDDEILDAQLDRLTRRVDEATAERRRITDLYQAGHIDMKELDRRATEVDSRRHQLEIQQNELTAQRHQLAVGNRLRQRVSNFANQAADGIDTLDFDQQQRLLRLIVEEIRVHGWQIELRLRIPLDAQPEDDHHPKHLTAATRTAAAACQAKTVCVRLVRKNLSILPFVVAARGLA